MAHERERRRKESEASRHRTMALIKTSGEGSACAWRWVLSAELRRADALRERDRDVPRQIIAPIPDVAKAPIRGATRSAEVPSAVETVLRNPDAAHAPPDRAVPRGDLQDHSLREVRAIPAGRQTLTQPGTLNPQQPQDETLRARLRASPRRRSLRGCCRSNNAEPECDEQPSHDQEHEQPPENASPG